MSDPHSYLFRLVPASQLPSGDPRDPFRFNREGESLSSRDLDPASLFSLEVIDRDRQLTLEDRYFYHSSNHVRRFLSSEDGLTILNQWTDPRILRRDGLGLVIQSGPVRDLPVLGQASPSDFIYPFLNQSSRLESFRENVPYWERDGHLDLDILEGLRTYTTAENQQWIGLQGLRIFADPNYFVRQTLQTGGIAASFMAGEYFVNPTFIWQTYTTNFLSSVTGSIENRQATQAHFRQFENLTPSSNRSPRERRLANIQMAEERARIAQDNLYWAFTVPIVGAACFADKNFTNFLRHPSILPRHFYSQFRTALPAIARSPFAFGAAALAGLGMYEISSRWYETYGGLRRGTTSNRIFSGGTTLLTEAALFSRTSREMLAITGSGDLTLMNLGRFNRMPLQWGISAEIQETSAFANYYMNSPRMQRFFESRSFMPTLRMSHFESPNPLASLSNRVGVPHFSLEARLNSSVATSFAERAALGETGLAAESVLARASLTEAAALEAREGLFLGEELLAASRVRMVGLPLTALLVGAGIYVGLSYLSSLLDAS